MPMPSQPKIYHILHMDRLSSVLSDGWVWCDATMVTHPGLPGTTIGMGNIKRRRLEALTLKSHPGLHVGDCVPFYSCPRSIMLYLLYQGNHRDLSYREGQEPIVHLEADLHETVAWAEDNHLRWAFTLSNAGAYYFEDRARLTDLREVDWTAVQATDWRDCKEGKQAEFLVERRLPWTLVSRIGVQSRSTKANVLETLENASHHPPVSVEPGWYYGQRGRPE